jgi:uncharacterized membrane protein
MFVEGYGFELWWIFPLVMIILCLFMMRGCMGRMTGRHDSHEATDKRPGASSDSAIEILNKRYALGDIGREEYEERKRAISQTD